MDVKEDWPGTALGYTLTLPIGYGAFATVYKAVVQQGHHKGIEVAIKVVDLDSLEGTTLDDIRRELQIMRLCTHPNVITYHVAFPVESKMWLIMPLVSGGSCQNIIRELRKLNGTSIQSEAAIAYILRETAAALNHFHRNQQIHRDLKAGNILLDTNGKVFLSDFGVSASMRDARTRQTFVGTPCWMAPEVLEQKEGYDYKADIWSFGVTAIELVTGSAPYQHLHPLKVMKSILELPPPRLESVSADPQLVKLVSDCLQKDPFKRPSIDQILIRYKSFFDKADQASLVEIIEQLPPLEARDPAKPPGYKSPRKMSKGETQLSGEWKFDDEDNKDDAEEFRGLGDSEF